MADSRRKIILIDGNSLVYRAFFALPTTLTLASGQTINAAYGFTSMLIRLLIDEKPAVVAVAFDSRGPTWRHEYYQEYKANRPPASDELHSQFPLVKDILLALNIPIFEMPGHEADDILATLTAESRRAGDEVIIVTSDKDALQLIKDEHVRVMTTRKGITDIVFYDKEKVIERFGVEPRQIPDFLGLKGDASDNIPGVPGVGDKTAAKLLQQFGTIESIYSSLGEVTSERLRENLAAHQEDAEMSKKLAVLSDELELGADLGGAVLGNWDLPVVRDVFTRLEFKTLLGRFETNLAGDRGEQLPAIKVDVAELEPGGLKDFLAGFAAPAQVGIGFILNSEPRATGVAVGWEHDNRLRAFTVGLGDLDRDTADILANWTTGVKSVFDLKSKLRLSASSNLRLEGEFFDPMLAAYLLAPAGGESEISSLADRYLQVRLEPDLEPVQAAATEAAASLILIEPLAAALEAEDLRPVYDKIELPLAKVLWRMEACGVGLDREVLRGLSTELGADLAVAEADIFALAGEEFNINSPQQVSKVLFDNLGLKPGRKTKTKGAYATDAAVLAKLAGEHPVARRILDYRELAKLKSTYIDALPKLVDRQTKRLHTSFNQAVTATGRLSSSNPNLQNIPARTELGRRIRRAFIPAHSDEKLMSADYSQIELRLLAHMSGDKALCRAFADNIDIHTATAAEVFGVPQEKVSSEHRRHAKAINFGIIYGMSPFGLSEQLNISAEEATTYIEKYFDRYPQVRAYLEKTLAKAQRVGYVSTLTGRKRWLPELKSSNYNQRSFGERVASNAPLQGSAADIIKIAMINIDDFLVRGGFQSRMVLQVHDELIFEIPPLEESVVGAKITELMESAYKLSVPLVVNIAYGRNWGEAK